MKVKIEEIDRIILIPENDSDIAVMKHMDELENANIAILRPLTSTVGESLGLNEYTLQIKAYRGTNLTE